ncbi:hypothetical protein Ddc_19702 [Ditylenchus destructor]|nr:hypothetical protein Ddc_19702 [Ditylenchus destructor]
MVCLFTLPSTADLRADGADMDHVLGLQRAVARLVALEEQVVRIEVGHRAAVAAQLDRRKLPAADGPPARVSALAIVARLLTV